MKIEKPDLPPKTFFGIDPAKAGSDITVASHAERVTVTGTFTTTFIDHDLLEQISREESLADTIQRYAKQVQDLQDEKMRAAMLAPTPPTFRFSDLKSDVWMDLLEDIKNDKYVYNHYALTDSQMHAHLRQREPQDWKPFRAGAQDVIHAMAKFGKELKPERAPVLNEVGTAFAERFIWGPCGEFTGILAPKMTEDARDYFSRASRYGNGAVDRLPARELYDWARDRVPMDDIILDVIVVNGRDYDEFVIGGRLDRDYSPSPRRDRYGEEPGLAVQFDSYKSLVNWSRGVNKGLTTQAFETDEAADLFVLLSDLEPDQDVLEDWLLALTKYKCGFGMLRDDKNRFDVLGVLADRAGGKWEWVQREGGWKIAGSDEGTCFRPSIEDVGAWLGVKAPRTHRNQLNALIDLFEQISDEETSFDKARVTLKSAMADGAIREEAWKVLYKAVERAYMQEDRSHRMMRHREMGSPYLKDMLYPRPTGISIDDRADIWGVKDGFDYSIDDSFEEDKPAFDPDDLSDLIGSSS